MMYVRAHLCTPQFNLVFLHVCIMYVRRRNETSLTPASPPEVCSAAQRCKWMDGQMDKWTNGLDEPRPYIHPTLYTPHTTHHTPYLPHHTTPHYTAQLRTLLVKNLKSLPRTQKALRRRRSIHHTRTHTHQTHIRTHRHVGMYVYCTYV